MEHCEDFETVASQSVGNHVGCARHDQFRRTGDSTRTAQVRQLGETLDRIEQYPTDSIGGRRVIARDVRAKVREVLCVLMYTSDPREAWGDHDVAQLAHSPT